MRHTTNNKLARRALRARAGYLIASARIALAGVPVVAALLLASPAAAFHIPGASYSGTVNGGGTVSFNVSADGGSVRDLRFEDIDGDICTFTFVQYNVDLPIAGNGFSDGGDVTGTFPSVQSARGTLNFSVPVGPGFTCDTGTQSWTARTTASPAGSQECKDATAAVDRAGAAADQAASGAEQAKKKAVKAKKKAKKAKKKGGRTAKRAKKKAKKTKQASEQAQQASEQAQSELAAAQQQRASNCGGLARAAAPAPRTDGHGSEPAAGSTRHTGGERTIEYALD